MLKLSAVVITRNEAARLAGCLASLAFADEIVVVDDASTDATVEIARQFTPHVVIHPHAGENWDLNKNVGMDLATGDWLLLVDADERVPPDLASELGSLLRTAGHEVAYWLPRREFYFGVHPRHAAAGAQVLRLFRKGAARFEGQHLHEQPAVTGAVGKLRCALDHVAYESIAQYVEKTNRYTDHEAAFRYARGDRAGWRAIVIEPLRVFRHRFFGRRGYKDGMPGLVYCVATSLYPLLQNLKIWELQQRAVKEAP